MKPHLEMAKGLWRGLLKVDDVVIDATCGNGKDTEELLRLVPKGQVIAIDIQKEAIDKCKEIILSERVTFILGSHAELPYYAGVKLIVYNLGYLPGGNKALTTMTETTLQSVISALAILIPGGALSIMCYPGHEEGEREQKKILQWAQELDPKEWKYMFYTWRKKSPNLFWIKRLDN